MNYTTYTATVFLKQTLIHSDVVIQLVYMKVSLLQL